MKNSILVTALLFSSAFFATAADYIVPFDDVQWKATKSIDGCTLYTEDRHSGVNVKFLIEGGKPLTMVITGRSVSSFNDNMIVESEMPSWGFAEYEVTHVRDIQRSKKSAQFSQGADFIYRDVVAGAWITVRDDFYSVTFPTANIRDALEVFQTCTTALPPTTFNQARKTILQFKSGAVALTPAQREQIDDISQLILLDKRIKTVRITGHSDDQGDMVVNLRVSKRRAEDVAYWMMLAGVPESMFEIRGQGSRYPIVSNKTKAGRDTNRRVEIELLKE